MSASTSSVFRLPDLGEGLTEAGLVQWLVAVGDTIVVDQPIAEVETAKSVVELPSPFAGVVTAVHGAPGEAIAVGAAVLEVGGPARPDTSEKEAYRAEERAGSGNVLIGYGTTQRSGQGRRRARPPQTSPPVSPSARAEPAPTTVAVRSPLIRRLARDLGLDLARITPTGADGVITRADVLRSAEQTPSPTAHPHAPAPVAGGRADGVTARGLAVLTREPLSPMRRAIGATLSRSRAEIPEATVWVDVDATALWQGRAEMGTAESPAPSLTALLSRFVLIALSDFPLLASRLSADSSEIVTFDGVNLGIAADTARGLIVPIIARADSLSLSELDAALRELAASARAGRTPADRLTGSTFTLNNYGSFGVDGSAPIINHPEVAMLGIGRMLERAWVFEGAITIRRIAQLSLVFDHRVCDGAYAAGFLRRIVDLIEHPMRGYGHV